MKQKEFDKFYRRNIDRIYRYVFFRIGQNHEIAEDLVSEIFLKALNKFDDYDEKKSKSAWIYTIAHNHLVNYYRDKKVEIDFDDLIMDSRLHGNDGRGEVFLEIEGILAKLSKEDRRLVTMKYLEGYKYSEMAEILGRQANALKVATHRSLKTIKDGLR
ncbi:RNA polymerase sigma factor [Patescibacteria group bacterium]|nr:RNA polymerase sigma factor [Patescibacteria group bacterium]MBU1705661.1 RNA polymerase sigma factor [Patescibacteria group bacterium]